MIDGHTQRALAVPWRAALRKEESRLTMNSIRGALLLLLVSREGLWLRFISAIPIRSNFIPEGTTRLLGFIVVAFERATLISPACDTLPYCTTTRLPH